MGHGTDGGISVREQVSDRNTRCRAGSGVGNRHCERHRVSNVRGWVAHRFSQREIGHLGDNGSAVLVILRLIPVIITWRRIKIPRVGIGDLGSIEILPRGEVHRRPAADEVNGPAERGGTTFIARVATCYRAGLVCVPGWQDIDDVDVGSRVGPIIDYRDDEGDRVSDIW